MENCSNTKNDILVSVKGSPDEYQLDAQLNGYDMQVAYIHPEYDFEGVSDKSEAHEYMEESMTLLTHVTDHHDPLLLDHLDKISCLELLGCKTYNGWEFEEGYTPYDALMYVVAKQIAFEWWLDGDLPK